MHGRNIIICIINAVYISIFRIKGNYIIYFYLKLKELSNTGDPLPMQLWLQNNHLNTYFFRIVSTGLRKGALLLVFWISILVHNNFHGIFLVEMYHIDFIFGKNIITKNIKYSILVAVSDAHVYICYSKSRVVKCG